jgi:DNA polymerase elongation subunit (family B)
MRIEEVIARLKASIRTPAKVIFLDIETAPSVGWVWGKWEQNVLDFKEDGYVMSFAVKRAGGKVIVKVLPDYTNYKVDRKDDSALLKDLWLELDNADIVIAHNGDRFDLPTINTRFLAYGWAPPSPYVTIDTLRVARRAFNFTSNKLDDLCRYLNIGRKMPHTGFDLWRNCMNGINKAWRTMRRYNHADVLLLEELYYRFLPWIPNHPNVNKGENRCIRCGSDKLKYDGHRFTNLRKKERIHCLNCAGWFEGASSKL